MPGSRRGVTVSGTRFRNEFAVTLLSWANSRVVRTVPRTCPRPPLLVEPKAMDQKFGMSATSRNRPARSARIPAEVWLHHFGSTGAARPDRPPWFHPCWLGGLVDRHRTTTEMTPGGLQPRLQPEGIDET